MAMPYLGEIAEQLNVLFKLDEFEPDLPFSHLVPGVYKETGVKLERYLDSTFLKTFHGLMIRNGQSVSKTYCIVFLSKEMLDAVLRRGEKDVLLISHHPLVMETSNRGFLPLSETYLVEMQKRAISVYVLHTPLDVHNKISTSRALARELGLEELQGCYQGPGGYAGVYGRFSQPVEFDDLLQRVTDVTGVGDLDYIRNHQAIRSVGIIAGGTDTDGIMETAALGCDLLLTGTYYNLVQNEIGQRYREEFDRIRDSLEISLIGCSHYASEAVVMRTDMVELCLDRFGIDCEFIPQEDPWY
jgi:putative NIF3 family GTP cyclohydrolase 1 type 2